MVNRIGVICDVMLGVAFADAVADAIALSVVESQADHAIVFVQFDFNGVQVKVTPHSDPHRIRVAYKAALGKPDAKVGPYPETKEP